MSEKNWLYLYENREQKGLYVGIGNSLSRVWGAHNSDAEKLRDADGTLILQTLKPFESFEDARKAEQIAIHVAMMAGIAVYQDEELLEDGVSEGKIAVTNRAGTSSSSVLGPAVLRVEGEVDFESLTRTAIVTITAEAMDSRPAPRGGLDGAVFSERSRQFWTVAEGKQSKIERLIAILKGSGGVILGDWDVRAGESYGPDHNVFPLRDPASDNPRGVKGMRLVGVRGQSGQIYSKDLRH